jgi:ubiquinone/menaquinone biosynthesis C-methylase UbiE
MLQKSGCETNLRILLWQLIFHHWIDSAKAFEELSRVLKSEGEFWIQEADGDLTPESDEWMKKKYNMIMRKLARLVMRIVSSHSITIEHAREILRGQKEGFAHVKVEQLEPLLVKMTLTKK